MPVDGLKENPAIEEFQFYSVSYVFQMRKEGCLKTLERKDPTEIKLALEDKEYKAKAEMVRSNVSWYFDININESPYFGFSPVQKDRFIAVEKVTVMFFAIVKNLTKVFLYYRNIAPPKRKAVKYR